MAVSGVLELGGAIQKDGVRNPMGYFYLKIQKALISFTYTSTRFGCLETWVPPRHSQKVGEILSFSLLIKNFKIYYAILGSIDWLGASRCGLRNCGMRLSVFGAIQGIDIRIGSHCRCQNFSCQNFIFPLPNIDSSPPKAAKVFNSFSWTACRLVPQHLPNFLILILV